MDEIDRKILKILSKHPEGLSYRQIWNKLRDEKGNHLIAFPTLLRRVDQLEKRGYLEIERSEWKRGRSMRIRLKGNSKVLSEYFNLIEKISEIFSKYERVTSSAEDFVRIYCIGKIFQKFLESIGVKITFSDLSEDLKRMLLSEIFRKISEINIAIFERFLKITELDLKNETLKEIFALYITESYMYSPCELENLLEKEDSEFLREIVSEMETMSDQLFELIISHGDK